MRIHRPAFRSIASLLIVLALIFSLGANLFGGAYAGALSDRKDTLETSVHATTSKHTFAFTTETLLTTDATATADFSVVINFPYDADSDAFTLPTFVAGDATVTGATCASQAFAVTAIEVSSDGGAVGNDEVLIAINETGEDSVDVPAGCVMTVVLGVTNKATNMSDITSDDHGCTAGATTTDADICPITAATSEDITGASPTAVDSGKVLVGLISGITVSATVAETFSFSIGAVSVNLGELNTSSVSSQTLTSTVSTNAQGGYTCTIQDNKTGSVGLASNGNDINDVGDGTVSAGSEEYGVSTDDNGNTLQYDADCATPFSASAATNSPQSYAANTVPVSSEVTTLCFASSVAGTTPTGNYSNTTVLIATPTF